MINYCRDAELHEKLVDEFFNKMYRENLTSMILNAKITNSHICRGWQETGGYIIPVEDTLFYNSREYDKLEEEEIYVENSCPEKDREGSVGILLTFEIENSRISLFWDIREYMRRRYGWIRIGGKESKDEKRVNHFLIQYKKVIEIELSIFDTGTKTMRPLLEHFIGQGWKYNRSGHNEVHALDPWVLETITIEIIPGQRLLVI